MQRLDRHVGHRHHGQVGALAYYMRLADGRADIAGGHLALHIVQPAMLQKNHRIGIEDAGQQQALGVLGGGGHHHFQAGNMCEPGLQTLRMSGPLPPAAPDDHADSEWHRPLAAEHEAPFGGIVDDLVHRQQRKIQPLMSHHRFQAVQRGANRDARHGRFRGGNVEHTLRAEPFLKTNRGTKMPLGSLAPRPKQITPGSASSATASPSRMALAKVVRAML